MSWYLNEVAALYLMIDAQSMQELLPVAIIIVDPVVSHHIVVG